MVTSVPSPASWEVCSIERPGLQWGHKGGEQVTIDERLEALVARHEALAESLELLVSLHRDDHERLAKTREDADKLLDTADRLLGMAKQDGENIRDLANIARMHERRLNALEGGE